MVAKIISAITLISTLAGLVFLVEDRYQKVSDSMCQVLTQSREMEAYYNELRLEIYNDEILSLSLLDTRTNVQEMKIKKLSARTLQIENRLRIVRSARC